jgi:hypothetical protein
MNIHRQGFRPSGKLGATPVTRRMGLGAIPIPVGPMFNSSMNDDCPAGYYRNALGVCMIAGPTVVAGTTGIFTTPLIMTGWRW